MNDRVTAEDGCVIVPEVNIPASVACLRSLGRRGIPTVLLPQDRPLPASVSRYSEETVSVPSPYEDIAGYERALLSLVAERDVVTIIPVREEDIYVLSKRRDAFTEHTSLVVPSFDTLLTAHDRLLLAEAAGDAGVPVPETHLFTDVDDWSRDLVIKARWNLLTSEYVESYRRSPVQIDAIDYRSPGTKPARDRVCEEMQHVPIVQEFVPKGGEYMFAALYDHGEPLATFQHEQLRGESYVGGGGVYRKSMYDPDLEAVARRLLDYLDWHGLACIEYVKHAETGEYVLIEINPRMWQSSSATARMGADFPYYYYLLATGRPEEIDPEYDLGVGCHYLQGELGYLASVLRDDSPLVERPTLRRTLWDLLTSTIRNPRFDYLTLDDPGPFFRSVSNVLSGLVRDRP